MSETRASNTNDLLASHGFDWTRVKNRLLLHLYEIKHSNTLIALYLWQCIQYIVTRVNGHIFKHNNKIPIISIIKTHL